MTREERTIVLVAGALMAGFSSSPGLAIALGGVALMFAGLVELLFGKRS